MTNRRDGDAAGLLAAISSSTTLKEPGVELAFQTFFDYDFLPAALKNFGVQGSYTHVKTELPVQLNGAGKPATIVRQPFQSDDNYSIAGLYESGFMSARIVYTYRSDFVLFGVSANPIDGRYLKGYGLLDASVNFNLRKDLTLSLTASNITDKAPQRYVGDPDNGYDTDILRQSYANGRIYGVSLRYKFGGSAGRPSSPAAPPFGAAFFCGTPRGAPPAGQGP